ncbi:MAG: YtxH domain-containing protein [Myxococcales bacterium]
MRWNDLRDMSKEDMLALLGLEPKRGFFEVALPWAGLFGAGLLVGAGLGMVLAPKAGHELRRELRERYGEKMTAGRAEAPAPPM